MNQIMIQLLANNNDIKHVSLDSFKSLVSAWIIGALMVDVQDHRGSHGWCSRSSGLSWLTFRIIGALMVDDRGSHDWCTAMNSFCVEEQISDIVLSTVLSILHFGPYREDDALGMTPEKMFLHICDAQPGEDKYVPYLRNKYMSSCAGQIMKSFSEESLHLLQQSCSLFTLLSPSVNPGPLGTLLPILHSFFVLLLLHPPL